jgi:hypothetical protein
MLFSTQLYCTKYEKQGTYSKHFYCNLDFQRLNFPEIASFSIFEDRRFLQKKKFISLIQEKENF